MSTEGSGTIRLLNALSVICLLSLGASGALWYHMGSRLDASEARLNDFYARSKGLHDLLLDSSATKDPDLRPPITLNEDTILLHGSENPTDVTPSPAAAPSAPLDVLKALMIDAHLQHRIDTTAKPPYFRFSWNGNCFLSKAIQSRILPSDRYMYFGDDTPGPGDVSVNTKLVDPRSRKWQLVVSKTADPRRTSEIYSTEIYEVRDDLARAYAEALVKREKTLPLCKSCHADCIKLITEEVKRLQKSKD